MDGGRYITIFPDDEKRETRAFLYKLENLGIVRFVREKEKRKGIYKHKWDLTEKGKVIVKKYPHLQKLLKDKKILEFYELIKDLQEIKED